LRWTPARIAGRLRHEFGKCYERNLCAETIYEWIYSDDAPADLRTLLPRKRRQRGQSDRRGKRAGVGKIPERTGIEERPEAAETRDQAGHLEGDTVIGKQGGAAIHTEAERQSRPLKRCSNPDARRSSASRIGHFRCRESLADRPLRVVQQGRQLLEQLLFAPIEGVRPGAA